MKKRLSAFALAFALILQMSAYAITAGAITKTSTYQSNITFTAADFTGAFDNTDTPGITLAKIKIAGLPGEGALWITEDDTPREVLDGEDILIENAGNLYFVPPATYSGATSFTWKAVGSDDSVSADAATVTLTIEAARPIALDVAIETTKDTPVNGTLKATDPLERALVYSIVATPTEDGTVTITDTATGAFTYTPKTGFTGTDTFTYKATAAGDVASNTAQVTVTVKAPVVAEPEIEILQYADMQSHWGLTSAGSLATLDILVGEKIQGKYYFHPESAVTRGEFILWLNSAIGLEPLDNATTVFEDYVPDWLGGAVNAAMEEKIVSGSLENGKLYLRYNNTLTRIEAIKMIDAALEISSTSDDKLDYIDMADVPDWGLTALKNLSDYKIIRGDLNNAVKPLAKMTRAEAAEMLFKAYKELSK